MPINKKSRFNNVITWLHLWLGLVSGIIVLVLGITGCLFAFQQELSDIFYRKTLFIEKPAGNPQTLPVSVLKDKAQNTLGKDKPVTYITTYPDSKRAWEFMCYEPGNDNAIFLNSSIKTYESVFINPYNGEVSGRINYLHEFFAVDKGLHISLLLNLKYGEPIVGIATLIFVVLLITGIIMWYPKNWKRRNRDAALKINWRAKWKRINYDLHNVLGFYVFFIALILAFTGLAMSFNWFRNLVYVAASASVTPPDIKTYNSDTTAHLQSANTMDLAFEQARQIYPGVNRLGITVPFSNTDAINITAYHTKDVYYDDDNLYFDQSSGKLLGKELYKELNNGMKALAMNYDIHIGAVGGLPGKIIAFLVSLICASLPVTGFYIWWGKGKKKVKSNEEATCPAEAALS